MKKGGIDTSRLEKKIKKLADDLTAAQIRAVQEATLMVHSTAVKSLQDNSDGTPQMRYGPKRLVKVSQPGDPPNTDTGRAVQSIKFEFENKGLTGSVGTNLKYLAAMEFGTSMMDPRPWLGPALDANSKAIKQLFFDRTNEILKKVENLK